MYKRQEYKASWERKLKFYEEIGYTLGENLFTTCDHENGAIMTEEVEAVSYTHLDVYKRQDFGSISVTFLLQKPV